MNNLSEKKIVTLSANKTINIDNVKHAGLWSLKFGADPDQIFDFKDSSSIEVKNKKRKNDKFYKKIFKKINFNFNNYHKISLSYLESEILFGLFLRRSLSIIKNRWDIVNFFYKKNYKFFINSGQNITFSFDTNFNNILREKTFNDFIFHEILKFLIKKKKIDKRKIIFKKIKKKKIVFLKNNLANFFFKFCYKYFTILKVIKTSIYISYLPIKYYENVILNLKFKNYFFFFKQFFLREEFFLSNIEHNKKKRNIFFKNLGKCSEFETFFFEFLNKIFPNCYIEYFDKYLKLFKPIKRYPKFIVNSTEHNHNFFLRLYIVLSKKNNNAKLFSLQHGGHEFFRNISDEFYDNQIFSSDKYFNWCKRSYKNKNGLFFLLDKYKNLYFPKKNKKLIIFFGNHSYYCGSVNFDIFNYLSKKNYSTIKKNTDILFSGLNKNKIFPSVRPFVFTESNYDYLDYIKNNFVIDKVFSRENFKSLLKNTKIAVFLCDTTAFYQALYYNIPCVLIISREFLMKGFKFKKYYIQLHKFKYIFTSPDQAVNFIIKLNNNDEYLRSWWMSKKNIRFREYLRNNLIYNEEKRLVKLYKEFKNFDEKPN